tara:strand:- start:78849 stop:79058 length:210 start_codon:yes stop_codon:yes gene_type:complete
MSHLKENNETYVSHMLFATKIGFSLICRGLIFVVHGVFPMFLLPKNLNIASAIAKLEEWHSYTIRRLDK